MFKFPVIALCLAMVAAVVGLAGCGGRPAVGDTPRQQFEAAAAQAGQHYLAVPYAVPPERAARSVVFTREQLRQHQLYLRSTTDGDFLHIDNHGVIRRQGSQIGQLRERGELLLTPQAVVLFADDRLVADDLRDWQLGWLTGETTPPDIDNQTYPLVDFVDSFMRQELLDGGHCRMTAGNWQLRQRGGGMATSEAAATNLSFQRAVNPFAAIGSNHGWLTYGDASWVDFRGGVSFYFGVPRGDKVTDSQTLPVDTDMLVAVGPPEGTRIAFGWRGAEAAFVLLLIDPAGETQVLDRHLGSRPPISNWFRLELDVQAAHRLVARLDGRVLFEAVARDRLAGPFSVVGGATPVECDDVEVVSLTLPPPPPSPLFVTSDQFAAKTLHDETHDPQQFMEWARGGSTFVQWHEHRQADDHFVYHAATRMPLLGDFAYVDQLPGAGTSGGADFDGLYTFAIVAATQVDDDPEWSATAPLYSFSLHRRQGAWHNGSLPAEVWPAGTVVKTLRFARRQAAGERLEIQVDGIWRPCSPPLPGSVRLHLECDPEARLAPALATPAARPGGRRDPRQRRDERERAMRANAHAYRLTSPERHQVSCRNYLSDLFERAPVDWSWLDGAFRMDCRWACQADWNFMACGSPAIPMMVSKRAFAGDQMHEYYLSLRPVFPWDAGDDSFEYDGRTDAHFAIFNANRGWYNRRDFNFSFCFDGRNPLSGYAILFGADDNRETRLLRRGELVARTSEPQFLFPTEYGHGVIHWRWWKFTVAKFGNQIRVWMNDQPMFEFDDPEPLPDGHAALWSVRNGFAVARFDSLAEQIDWRPQVLYVENDAAVGWQAIPADSLTLRTDARTGLTSARHNLGAGFFAVRRALATPVDLAATPILELPLHLPPGVAINLHLLIGEQSYLLPISAPLAATKSLLTPTFEKGECFQLPVLDPAAGTWVLGQGELEQNLLRVDLGRLLEAKGVPAKARQLRSLTLGNTSNHDYLLAGGGNRNQAGQTWQVGEPRFR